VEAVTTALCNPHSTSALLYDKHGVFVEPGQAVLDFGIVAAQKHSNNLLQELNGTATVVVPNGNAKDTIDGHNDHHDAYDLKAVRSSLFAPAAKADSSSAQQQQEQQQQQQQHSSAPTVPSAVTWQVSIANRHNVTVVLRGVVLLPCGTTTTPFKVTHSTANTLSGIAAGDDAVIHGACDDISRSGAALLPGHVHQLLITFKPGTEVSS
jgi:hypothetical protein